MGRRALGIERRVTPIEPAIGHARARPPEQPPSLAALDDDL